MKHFANADIHCVNLRNKLALITGGARMGESIALALARHGVDVVLTYRSSKASAIQIQKNLLKMGRQSWVTRCDVTREADIKKLMQFIQKKIGHLDILINLASTYEKTPWDSLNEKVWQQQIDNNVKGTYLMGIHASKLLKKHGGRIINFADWVVASGRPNYKNFTPYYAAKSAVLGLTQVQALELAPTILVNAIAPGPIIPPAGATKKEINTVMNATPLRRWGGASEIAKAVLFLCATDFVTGECIRVDGGRHLY